jgi:hypothetical protein
VEKHSVVAVDIAKVVFDVAVSHEPGRVAERKRLSRGAFSLFSGGLALDLSSWVSTSKKFFLPIDSLREVFRGKLLHKIEQALRQGSIPFPESEGLALLKRASTKTWDIDIKAPLDGPHHVVRYLS